MAKYRRYRWQNEKRRAREAQRSSAAAFLVGELRVARSTTQIPLSDPAERKSHYTTREQRMRRGTGEFADWLTPGQRAAAVECYRRMVR